MSEIKNDQIVEIKDEDIKEEDFSPEELEADTTDWKAKALELKGIAKRRATQLAKAKEKLTNPPEIKPEPKPQDKPIEKKSNEPDYARLAYLETKGINHPDDQSFITGEAERLKLPLTEILNMQYVKERLQASNDSRTAQAGMPKGNRRSGETTQHDVDYWLSKGGLPENDQELAEKVVDARMGKEKSHKFSDEMFVG